MGTQPFSYVCPYRGKIGLTVLDLAALDSFFDYWKAGLAPIGVIVLNYLSFPVRLKGAIYPFEPVEAALPVHGRFENVREYHF